MKPAEKFGRLPYLKRHFETLDERINVIHHTRLENEIRVRVLSSEKPIDGAIVVNPTLEDSYLWLLKK